jgi:hypothetical protein
MKMEFKETMEKTKKQMNLMLQAHMDKIVRQSSEMIKLLMTSQNSLLSAQRMPSSLSHSSSSWGFLYSFL